MNKKLIAAIMIICATGAAQATLIDLTPGGYPGGGLPSEVLNEINRQVFFDQAVQNFPGWPNGWISRFGRLNGGTYFFTDLIGRNTAFASVSWNMTGQQDGFWMSLIDVFGRAQDGTPWEHVYRVDGHNHFRFVDLGDIVTLNGEVSIMSIAFYGQKHQIPESGTALILFGLGLAALKITKKRF